MTERKLFENILVELNTFKAPSLHLEDYVYWANKGIQEYINLRYNLYSQTQQLTDDLQSLYTSVFAVIKANSSLSSPLEVQYSGGITETQLAKMYDKYGSSVVACVLPTNYLHFLSGASNVRTIRSSKCSPVGYLRQTGLARLRPEVDSDSLSNVYNQPGPKKPYYYVVDDYLTSQTQGAVEVFYGSSAKFKLEGFTMSYLKKPGVITLSEAQVNLPKDTSRELEFPDYVCGEITKSIIRLILENQQNPRLQSNSEVNKTIA